MALATLAAGTHASPWVGPARPHVSSRRSPRAQAARTSDTARRLEVTREAAEARVAAEARTRLPLEPRRPASLLAGAPVVPGLYGVSGHGDPGLVSVAQSARTLSFEPGNLVTASEKNSTALQVRFVKETNTQVKRVPLGKPYVGRGVDIDSSRHLVAIAAVSQVILYDSVTGEVTVLTGTDPEIEAPFGFVNDVLFDGAGGLVIADMGHEIGQQLPRDGRVWRYDLESATFSRLGSRRKFSNPKLLARDKIGRIYVVDGDAGPKITLLLEERYDMVFRLSGATQQIGKIIFRKPGLVATAFDIASDNRRWFGSVGELAVLSGVKLIQPCDVKAQPFAFATGLAIDDSDRVFVMDGVQIKPGPRTVYEVEDDCSVTRRVGGDRIARARGLSVVRDIAS